MSSSCVLCRQPFEITNDDLAFYDDMSPTFAGKKFPIPPPTLCPDCRQQRRVAQANQLNLYERKCDLTGATIISNFHPGSPYKVHRQQDWYSDKWDPLEYGRDFDFRRPFFEQFRELSLAVPRPALHKAYEFDENADYTNYAGRNKNCYLIFDAEDNRDCYYDYSVNHTESCMECFRIRTGELLYGCIDCVQCYNSAFLQDCVNCSDSVFLKNCIGCKHCIMCSNMKNKEYCIENKQVGKAEFERLRALFGSYKNVQSAAKRFEKLKLEYPQKSMHGVQNENISGDYLTNCKNAAHCFDSPDLWDCKYVFQAFAGLKNSMDIQECGEAERLYECAFGGYNTMNCLCFVHCLGGQSDMYYCMHSPHSKQLFGCVGCRHKEYCVFNKQYSKDDYEELVARIVAHMQKTNEWGEFFPMHLALFAYNESLAMDYYPLSKEGVEARGWQWRSDDDKKEKYMGPSMQIPDSIADADQGICKKILTCEATGKLYKIIPQELTLYTQMHLPLPRKCFLARHKERIALRNPRKLWGRECMKCKKEIMTTYAPERPEIVYCEECYLKSVY